MAGSHAYVAAGGAGLLVLDISDPNQLRRIGGYDTPGEACAVEVSGSLAYVADGPSGVLILDISDPASPRLTGSFDTSGNVCAVAVSSNLACLADAWRGLQLVDVSRPDHPQRVGSYTNDFIDNAKGIALVDDYAYVADHWIGVQVVDIRQPANPRYVTGYTNGFGEAIAIANHHVFLADGWAGLQIIDITNPATPRWVGGCDTPGSAVAVAVSGDFAYVADDWAGLQVIDIADVRNPRHVLQYETPGPAVGIAISDGRAFVAEHWAGLHVIDISQPTNPRWLSAHDTAVERKALALSDPDAFVADGSNGLKIFNIRDSTPPLEVGHFDSPGQANAVVVSSNYAYVADGPAGLLIIDITDRGNPRRVGGYNTSGDAKALALSGNHVYVANGPGGLIVFDVSDPGDPQRVGACDTKGFATGVVREDRYAYVTDYSGGLSVVDVDNPANPRLVGICDTEGEAQGLAVRSHYAYVADGWNGLQVIDVDDPARPRKVGGHDTRGFAVRVTLSPTRAYVADSFGLQIFDITEPTRPRLVDERNAIPALDIALADEKLLVATRSEPLLILDSRLPLRLEASLRSDRTLDFLVSGPPTLEVRVQRSSNLTDWDDWQTFTLSEEPTHFSDPDGTVGFKRFYRAVSTAAVQPTAAQESDIPQVILDSDIGADGDDLGDIVLLHKLADLGLCNIIGTIHDTSLPWGAPCLEAFNIAYGRPDIPVGTLKNPYLGVDDLYTQYITEHYPNTLSNGVNAPDARRLYRKLLAEAPDKSVTIIEAAFLVNLAELFWSPPDDISPLTGEQLLNRKVKLLAIAAGDYPAGQEYYFNVFPVHAAVVVNNLTCPMIFSGDTLGFYTRTLHRAQVRQLVPTNSILRDACEQFFARLPLPNRQAWSQVLIYHLLYESRVGTQKFFRVHRGGYNFVDETGGNVWRTDGTKDHAYLVGVADSADITAALTALIYRAPGEAALPYDPHVDLFDQLVHSTGGTVGASTLRALDTYVKALKADGTWSAKKLIWPCVGNDVNSALCLLKYPWGMSNGRLKARGGELGSYAQATGFAGNGQFHLDTGISPYFLDMRKDTCHLAVYSRTEAPGQGAAECGRYEGANVALTLALKYGLGYSKPIFDSFATAAGGRLTASTEYPTTGYFVGSRIQFNDVRLYRNGQRIANGNGDGGELPANSVLLFSEQEAGRNIGRTLSYFSCGPGMSPQQIQTDQRAVQALRAALGRSVNE